MLPKIVGLQHNLEVAQLVRAPASPAWGTQVFKDLGSNPAAVYWG